MFPKGESIESEIDVNSIWIEEDLIASTSFEILKDPLQYEREKTAAEGSIHDIFIKNDEIIKAVQDSVKEYNGFLLSVLDSDLFLGEQILDDQQQKIWP